MNIDIRAHDRRLHKRATVDEAFLFQVATDGQAETARLWNAIVGTGAGGRRDRVRGTLAVTRM